MKQRRKKLLVLLLFLLGAGILYAGLCLWAGRGLIPCPVRLLTGLKCPGCGVTTMILALLQLDIKGAWEANGAVMILLLPGTAFAVLLMHQYVKTGKAVTRKWQNIVLWGMILFLVLFALLRNVVPLFF